MLIQYNQPQSHMAKTPLAGLEFASVATVQFGSDKMGTSPHASSTSSMAIQINKVAVLGAGTMGSRIAAHLANAGVSSYLLDIVPPGSTAGKTESAIPNATKSSPQG